MLQKHHLKPIQEATQALKDFSKAAANFVESYYPVIELAFDAAHEMHLRKTERKNLQWKQFWMGLTYAERRRLEELKK